MHPRRKRGGLQRMQRILSSFVVVLCSGTSISTRRGGVWDGRRAAAASSLGVAAASHSSAGSQPECQVTDVCRICTSTDLERIEECAETGKVEYVTCPITSSEDPDVDGEPQPGAPPSLDRPEQPAASSPQQDTASHYYRSCARTPADEEFLLVRLQVACLLVGVLSLASVRRQKAATASLFDQRRNPPPRPDKKRASQLGVELAPMHHNPPSSQGDDETVPLTGGRDSPLEVV